jgi:hypothetical protein
MPLLAALAEPQVAVAAEAGAAHRLELPAQAELAGKVLRAELPRAALRRPQASTRLADPVERAVLKPRRPAATVRFLVAAEVGAEI